MKKQQTHFSLVWYPKKQDENWSVRWWENSKGKEKKKPHPSLHNLSLHPANGGNHNALCSSSSIGMCRYHFCHDVTPAPRAEHQSANTARQHQDLTTWFICGSQQVFPDDEVSCQHLKSRYWDHKPALKKAMLLLLFYPILFTNYVLLINLNNCSVLQ